MFGENILLELQDSLSLEQIHPVLEHLHQALGLRLAEEVQCRAEMLVEVEIMALSHVSLQLPQTAWRCPNLGLTEDALHRHGGHIEATGEDNTLPDVARLETYQIEKPLIDE